MRIPISATEVARAKITYNLTERNNPMLWTIFVILLVLWLLGLVSSYTLGGFIHILLVIAIVVLIIQLIRPTHIISSTSMKPAGIIGIILIVIGIIALAYGGIYLHQARESVGSGSDQATAEKQKTIPFRPCWAAFASSAESSWSSLAAENLDVGPVADHARRTNHRYGAIRRL